MQNTKITLTLDHWADARDQELSLNYRLLLNFEFVLQVSNLSRSKVGKRQFIFNQRDFRNSKATLTKLCLLKLLRNSAIF